MKPTGESHGWRDLVGCSPWGRAESDMTKQLTLTHRWLQILASNRHTGSVLLPLNLTWPFAWTWPRQGSGRMWYNIHSWACIWSFLLSSSWNPLLGSGSCVRRPKLAELRQEVPALSLASSTTPGNEAAWLQPCDPSLGLSGQKKCPAEPRV